MPKQTIALLIEIEAESEREAWKIIDRVLNREGDDEIINYTEHPEEES